MKWWERFRQSRGPEILALVWLVWSVARLGTILPGRTLHFDFNHYYTSSWLLRHGESPYRADLIAVSRQLGFVPTESIPHATNPPALLWLLVPFTWLPPVPAFWGWALVLAGAWGMLVWLTVDLLGERLSRRGRVFCVVYWGSATAVFCNFYFAHVELVLAVLVLGAYRCLARGRAGWAVGLVCGAGVLKLFPLALVPWFVWRGGATFWQRVRYAGLAVVLVGAGVVGTGWGWWREFWEIGLPVVSGLATNYSFNFSLAAFASNVFLAVRKWMEADWPVKFATTVAGWTGAAVLLIGYGWVWRERGRDLEREFCWLCVMLLMASLTAWGFYFVFLFFPVVVLAARLSGRGTRRQWLWWGIGVLMLEVMQTIGGPFVDQYYGLKVAANYLPMYGALILGGLIVLLRETP